MRRNTKAGDVNADDAHTVDLARQKAERHAGRGGNAEVDHHDRVDFFWIGQVMDGLADILEQLSGDQRFRIERHIANRAARAIKMRNEGQAIDAAGRTGQDGRGAAHAQADAQRTEGRAHALRLVVRTGGIILGVARERFARAGFPGGVEHGLASGVAAESVHADSAGRASSALGRARRFVRNWSVGGVERHDHYSS